MKKVFYLFLGAALFIAACKKEQAFSRFSTNLLLPLLHTELDLSNVISDSVLVPDANGALRLVTSYDMYRGGLSDLLAIPDTERVNTLSLKTLRLADQSQTQAVPLFLIFPQATALNGQTVPIPATSNAGLGAIPIDGADFFKEATFNSGTMEITITNGYPVEISTLIFRLSNVVDGSIIQTDTFSNILPGNSKTKIIDVSGKKLYAQMEATPILVETAASNGPVLVNQFAITTINFSVKDLKPQSAIARFPAQSVISSDETVVYYFGEAQLKELKASKGKVSFRVVSTIEEQMQVDYQIPYATRNGQAFKQRFWVPAAPPGGTADFRIEYDISGYEIDLRGKDPNIKDTVNSLYNILDVTIDSTGIERNISLGDSIFLYLGLIDLEPEYAEGYFGSEVFEVGPETIDVDFFTRLKGDVDFEDLNFNIVLENGIGAQAEAKINQLTSRNTQRGTAVQLTGGGINGTHILPSATYPPFKPSITPIPINSGNSNIKPFIEQLPNKMDYHLTIKTNPNGNTNNFKDFATGESELAATLEVDMPVSLKTNGITLVDTVNFDLAAAENSKNILEGSLNIVADNGFPFDVELQLYLMDENGTIIDSLIGFNNNVVQAAPADANNRVISPLRSVVIAKADQAKMAKLRSTKKILIKATVRTPKTNTNYWKMYSDYGFKVSLTGDFIYDQNY